MARGGLWYFHLHSLTRSQNIAWMIDALITDLSNVAQSIGLGVHSQQLHESAVIHDSLHNSIVNFKFFDFSCSWRGSICTTGSSSSFMMRRVTAPVAVTAATPVAMMTSAPVVSVSRLRVRSRTGTEMRMTTRTVAAINVEFWAVSCSTA